jgi:uncharacterized RDD family membrane protein YckC
MEKQKFGKLYRRSDYPGVLTRIMVDLIDVSTILALCVMTFIVAYLFTEQERVMNLILFGWVILAFGYLGPWKATGFPTLGYFMFRVKIVNSQGNQIDFWQASGRALFLLFGPANYLIDLFWLYGETPRQALRDKFTGTYLIKNNAVLESEGKLVSKVLHVMGYRVQIEEIQRIG